jgi:hypothetical protein
MATPDKLRLRIICEGHPLHIRDCYTPEKDKLTPSQRRLLHSTLLWYWLWVPLLTVESDDCYLDLGSDVELSYGGSLSVPDSVAACALPLAMPSGFPDLVYT